jgi:hypothetical protein
MGVVKASRIAWGKECGMQIPKPTKRDKINFPALIAAAPGVGINQMFGNLGALAHGDTAAPLFGTSIGARLLDEGDRHELVGIEGTRFFGPAQHTMGVVEVRYVDWSILIPW